MQARWGRPEVKLPVTAGAEDPEVGDRDGGEAGCGRILSQRLRVSKAAGIKSRSRNLQSEIQDAGKDGKASSPWGLPLLPSFRAGRKEEAFGGGAERASEGLLGQLNQRNYFPTDEAKNILMAFS